MNVSSNKTFFKYITEIKKVVSIFLKFSFLDSQTERKNFKYNIRPSLAFGMMS